MGVSSVPGASIYLAYKQPQPTNKKLQLAQGHAASKRLPRVKGLWGSKASLHIIHLPYYGEALVMVSN